MTFLNFRSICPGLSGGTALTGHPMGVWTAPLAAQTDAWAEFFCILALKQK
jgi:hypothetical protein